VAYTRHSLDIVKKSLLITNMNMRFLSSQVYQYSDEMRMSHSLDRELTGAFCTMKVRSHGAEIWYRTLIPRNDGATYMECEFLVNIIDGDDGLRKSVAELVLSLKLSPRQFETAEEFLTTFDDAPGCLITDLRMPGMSGLELLEVLRGRSSEIPVIFVSGFPETSVVVDIMQCGALTFLEKPIRQDELCSAVRAAVKHDANSRHDREERQEIESRLTRLSANEQSVLELMIDGCPNKSIAVQLGIAVRTVESRRRAVFETMHVNSVARLVQDVMVLSRGRRPASPQTRH
jgi:two-component system response regulator FixJ